MGKAGQSFMQSMSLGLCFSSWKIQQLLGQSRVEGQSREQKGHLLQLWDFAGGPSVAVIPVVRYHCQPDGFYLIQSEESTDQLSP